MENFYQIMDRQFLGITLLEYVTAIFLFGGLVLLLKIIEKMALSRIRKLSGDRPHHAVSLLIQNFEKIVIPTLYFAAFYFSFRTLVTDPQLGIGFRNIWLAVLSIQTIRLLIVAALYIAENYWLQKNQQTAGTFAAKTALGLLQFVIWAVGVIFLLDNLGFNVSAVVAGLGIGGVAVALAAQTILGDLFNYFVIFFDRPFEEGDFIIFDDYMGVIENIGIKSTRIRSLGGEQIVISNSNLTGAKIRNYKRMAERRVLFKIGIVYETPMEKVKKVPEILKGILKSIPKVRIDRAHFKSFGDYSLDFEIVYYVLSPDYNIYMDTQQQINLEIMNAFIKEGIEFAYPTAVEYQKSLD